jgi:hypothetical protein
MKETASKRTSQRLSPCEAMQDSPGAMTIARLEGVRTLALR